MPVTRSALHSSGYATEDRFWGKLSAQGAYLGNNIGVMCTADGTWLGDKDVGKALAAWRRLPADRRRPGAVTVEDRGPFDPARGVEPPPGGLAARVFIRELRRDEQGRLDAPRKRRDLWSGGTRFEILEEPNRDTLWLTEAEWRALVPERPRAGESFPLPPSVRDRLARFHLVDGAKGLSWGWRPQDVRAAEMTLTVREVSPAAVRLRLDGLAVLMDNPVRARAGKTADVRLLGYLDYDRAAGRFTRFDVVALGPFRVARGGGQGVSGGGQSGRTVLGFAFELVPAAAAANVVPPRGTRLYNGSSKGLGDYFRGAPGVVRAPAGRPGP